MAHGTQSQSRIDGFDWTEYNWHRRTYRFWVLLSFFCFQSLLLTLCSKVSPQMRLSIWDLIRNADSWAPSCSDLPGGRLWGRGSGLSSRTLPWWRGVCTARGCARCGREPNCFRRSWTVHSLTPLLVTFSSGLIGESCFFCCFPVMALFLVCPSGRWWCLGNPGVLVLSSSCR